MYHIKNDQRSIRSSEIIFEGLTKLIHKKAFNSITVTNLVDAAGIGRTTFYRHFDEVEDVLRMRCEQVAEGLIEYLQSYRQNYPDEAPTTLLKPVLRYFYLHSELIELLMKANRIYMFEEALLIRFQPFKPMFAAYYGLDDDYVDYVMVMRIGGITNILTHWIKTGKKQAPDELADKLGAIVSNMVALEQIL